MAREAREVAKVIFANKWNAQQNPMGLWAIGPVEDGVMKVCGMGRTFMEAFEMAEKTLPPIVNPE